MNTAILTASSTSVDLYNKNIESCLKETANLTNTLITNVCTGQTNIIPLGFWDIAVYSGIILFIIACIVIMVAIAWNFFEGY